MNGFPSLVCLLGLSCACTRDFYHVLAAPAGPVQNIFFLTASPSKLDGQSCWFTCLLVYSSFKTLLYIRLCTHSYLSLVLKIVFWCRPRLVSCILYSVHMKWAFSFFSQNTNLLLILYFRTKKMLIFC
jgi:hypothetical protein